MCVWCQSSRLSLFNSWPDKISPYLIIIISVWIHFCNSWITDYVLTPVLCVFAWSLTCYESHLESWGDVGVTSNGGEEHLQSDQWSNSLVSPVVLISVLDNTYSLNSSILGLLLCKHFVNMWNLKWQWRAWSTETSCWVDFKIKNHLP